MITKPEECERIVYFAGGLVDKMIDAINALTERVEALENHKLYIGPYSLTLPKPEGGDYAGLGPKALSSTHQVPVKQPTGSFICDACGKDWGDGSALFDIEPGSRDSSTIQRTWTWVCNGPRKHGCGGDVTWHSEPKAFSKATIEDSLTVQAGTEPIEPITSQLKQCPFCGCNAVSVERDVCCTHCEAGMGGDKDGEAVAAWNRRAIDDDDSVNVLQYDLFKAKEEIARLKAENEKLRADNDYLKYEQGGSKT